ncbi:hypothetical protein NEOLEDRAFT_1246385 [Neolentinus lepideus HHB14362 ss-1]|uniref:Uncharacterized protein n=1 Tax=Neolentinus lepideus HHB14362 ss-1 TaxID=1314782 RepID=A0A165MNP5_9AGAM|nr:hypothetical protein NEOLEDRAFT_1246385 [Neolentinus lepideus HHB14362 ss-1]
MRNLEGCLSRGMGYKVSKYVHFQCFYHLMHGATMPAVQLDARGFRSLQMFVLQVYCLLIGSGYCFLPPQLNIPARTPPPPPPSTPAAPRSRERQRVLGFEVAFNLPDVQDDGETGVTQNGGPILDLFHFLCFFDLLPSPSPTRSLGLLSLYLRPFLGHTRPRTMTRHALHLRVASSSCYSSFCSHPRPPVAKFETLRVLDFEVGIGARKGGEYNAVKIAQKRSLVIFFMISFLFFFLFTSYPLISSPRPSAAVQMDIPWSYELQDDDETCGMSARCLVIDLCLFFDLVTASPARVGRRYRDDASPPLRYHPPHPYRFPRPSPTTWTYRAELSDARARPYSHTTTASSPVRVTKTRIPRLPRASRGCREPASCYRNSGRPAAPSPARFFALMPVPRVLIPRRHPPPTLATALCRSHPAMTVKLHKT